jgi:CO/xanthine dehydrogenase FAD-binding subunit
MEAMVEIQDVPFHKGEKSLRLGIQAKLDDVLTLPQCPVFLQSVLFGKITWQKRSEFNISRTLTVPGLAPQWVGALLAWGAWVRLEDGHEIELSEALELPDQIRAVELLSIPLEVPDRLWAEARTGSTPNDFPIVWALAVVDAADGIVQRARIALTGVWRQSVALANSAELLVGEKLDAETIKRVAAAVAEEATPVGDYRGSEEYRRDMAGVMTRRALEACLEGVEA